MGTAAGFTIPEMIAVIIIAAIIAAVAIPRFVSSGFDEARFYQETGAALRYAQRTAATVQRTVCVAFSATTVTLTYASTYGSSTCDTSLVGPGGAAAPYTVTAQGSAGFSPTPTDFSFDRIGRPSAAQTISLNDGRQIVIETESGYVH